MIAECDDFKQRLKHEEEHLFKFADKADIATLKDKEDF